MLVISRASTRHGLLSSRALFLRGHGFFRVFLLVVLLELVVIHERLLADGARRLEAVRSGAAELGLALLGSSGFFAAALSLESCFCIPRAIAASVVAFRDRRGRSTGDWPRRRQPLSLPKRPSGTNCSSQVVMLQSVCRKVGVRW